MTKVLETRAFRSRFANSLVARALFLVGMALALATAVFIVLSLVITGQRAQEQARHRLDSLIEAIGSTAGVACFEDDQALAQETAQALVKSSDVLRAVVRCGDAQLAFAERLTDEKSSPTGTPVVRSLFSPLYTYEQIGEISVTPNSHAIDQAVADEVRRVGLMMALFAIGILVAIGLATNIVILRPVKAISTQLHCWDAGSETRVSVPPHHVDNVLGRLVGEVNDLLHRFRVSLQSEHERQLKQVLDEKLRLADSRTEDSAQLGAPAADSMPDSGEDAAPWRLDKTSWRLAGPGDRIIPLTHAETAFLAALAESPGKAVSRGDLIAAMGHSSEYYDRRRLDTFVSRLRKKVSTACGAALPLRSIHAYGYALAAPMLLE